MEYLALYRTRIAILWVMAIMAFLGYAAFAAMDVPENFSNLSLVTGEEVVNVSVVMMVLAFLSLVLKGWTNRLTNIIGGSLIAFGTLIALADGVTVNPYGIYNLMMGAVVVLMVSIIWLARRMPSMVRSNNPRQVNP